MDATREPDDLRFGPFELRAAQRQLLCDGAPCVLGARAFDVLATLVAHRGRALTKAELLSAAWPGRVVEENNLTVQVSALRKLLGAGAITTVPGLGYQFTARVGAEPAAARLEPAHAGLYGRDAELRQLGSALADHALVTLTGAAGLGKTRLARALAAGTDAVVVELAALAPQRGAAPDPAPVGAAVGAALGLAPSPGAPVDRLLKHLRQPGGVLPLVILDNCEHLDGAAAELVRLMHGAAPALRVLATSQVPLRLPDEAVVRLEPLAVPAGAGLAEARASPAVALFVARAAALAPGFALDATNAQAVLDICRRLEGIPLALELAAARVPLLGTDGLRDRLGERLRLLARDKPPGEARHATLRAALDWSHGLLAPAEQALLRRLGVFAGGFTATAAQELACDDRLDAWAVLDGLGALVERSLVVAPGAGAHPAEPRFMLLETVRDYAREQLAAHGEAEAIGRRHAEQFEALAQAHGGIVGGDQAGARRLRLEGEHDNLRAALDWAGRHDVGLALRMAVALIPFWRERGHHVEAMTRCATLLARPAAGADALPRLRVQLGIAMIANELGDADRTQSAGEAALVMAQELGDQEREANAHAVLAHAAGLRGDAPLRRKHYEASLRLYRRLGDVRLVAEGLNNVGSCWCAEGEPVKARPLLDEALPLARQSGHRWLEAAILHSTSEVECALGEFAVARGHLEASLALRRGLQHKYHLVMNLQALARVAIQLDRAQASAAELREALSLCVSHGFAAQALPCIATAGAWAVARDLEADAAMLIGHVDEQLRVAPDALQPTDAELHRWSSTRLQALVPEAERGRWMAAGRALTRDEALRRALAMLDAAPA